MLKVVKRLFLHRVYVYYKEEFQHMIHNNNITWSWLQVFSVLTIFDRALATKILTFCRAYQWAVGGWMKINVTWKYQFGRSMQIWGAKIYGNENLMDMKINGNNFIFQIINLCWYFTSSFCLFLILPGLKIIVHPHNPPTQFKPDLPPPGVFLWLTSQLVTSLPNDSFLY